MIKIKINSRLKEGREAPPLDYGVLLEQDGEDFTIFLIDIEAMIDKIMIFRENFGGDRKINGHNFFEFLADEEDEDSKNPAVIGFLEAKQENTPDNPCMRAYDVSFTAVHESRSGQGIGKLMYLLAMAQAAKKGKPMMPDRLHVEPDAIHIWNSFNNDSSIVKSFDKTGKPAPGKEGEHSEDIASYFDVDTPKKTKMKIDDCKSSAETPYGDKLNRAYYSDKMYPQLTMYINKFKTLVANNFANTAGISDGIDAVCRRIFRRRFNG